MNRGEPMEKTEHPLPIAGTAAAKCDYPSSPANAFVSDASGIAKNDVPGQHKNVHSLPPEEGQSKAG
jgi:hypothetical protein